MSAPIKVAFPLAGLNLSGGVKTLLAQASHLAAAGHCVWLIVPDFAAVAPFPCPGVQKRVLCTGPRHLPLIIRKALYYPRLAWVSAAGADVCVAAYYPTVYCAVVARWLRRSKSRVVYSVSAYEPVTHGHSAESGHVWRRVRAALARLSYRLPTQRVFASRWLREQVGDADQVIVGRGIDLGVFSTAGREPRARGAPLRIGTIGRSGAVKGYAVLEAALRASRLPGPALLRVVAPDPVPLPPPDIIPTEALPALDEAGMAAFYRGCDIFVFPSLSEGFPAPPLEAMACGCAVLATASGGIDEYARHGTNCWIVPPGDPAALARGLEHLAADDALRARLAEGGVRTAQQFDRARALKRFRRLIESLAPRRFPHKVAR